MNYKSHLFMVIFTLIMTAGSSAAADAGALYKSKCSGCHGANGEGKPAVKAPSLKATQMDASQIAQHLTKGEPTSKPPHNKGISKLTEEQAASLADYVKSLK